MTALLETILLILNILVYMIIASAIFSWLYAFNIVNPRNQFVSTIGNILYQLTEPLLRPIRKFIPNMGSLDISPIVLIVIIFFIQRLIINNVYPLVAGY